MILLYVIGYLFIAWVVAKLYKKIRMMSVKPGTDIDEDAILIGIAWILTVPMGLMFLIIGGLIMVFVEGGKKLI